MSSWRRRNTILTGLTRADGLILPSEQAAGIKRDWDNPAYTWRDLEGEIRQRETGAGKPTYATISGLFKGYAFAAGDITDLVFHWPHDHVPGSPVFIHTHWTHEGTSISGNLSLLYVWSFAKGYGRGTFSGKTGTLTHTFSAAGRAQLSHEIDEIAWAVAGTPSTGQIATTDLETDGLLLVSLESDVIPTITGGSVNKPFILYSDLHYLSNNVGTLERNAPFG